MLEWRSWLSLSPPSSGWNRLREWNDAVLAEMHFCHLAHAATFFGLKPQHSH